MKNCNTRVSAEYSQGTWGFVDPSNPGWRVTFDQAVIDVISIRRNLVEGIVKSIYGIDQEISRHFDAQTRATFGISANPRLGKIGTIRRVRLLPGGEVQDT